MRSVHGVGGRRTGTPEQAREFVAGAQQAGQFVIVGREQQHAEDGGAVDGVHDSELGSRPRMKPRSIFSTSNGKRFR